MLIIDIIQKLIQNPELTDSLFDRIDGISQNINGYEYGLPLYEASHKALLREALYKWIIEIFEQ